MFVNLNPLNSAMFAVSIYIIHQCLFVVSYVLRQIFQGQRLELFVLKNIVWDTVQTSGYVFTYVLVIVYILNYSSKYSKIKLEI